MSGHPEFPVETAAEIRVLLNSDPVALDLLVRSNLVQSVSIALLNKTMSVAPDVMLNLRHLLDREVERQDHEWMEIIQRLTITEKKRRTNR